MICLFNVKLNKIYKSGEFKLIHQAIATDPPVAITILTWKLFCFARMTDERKYRQYVQK